MQELLRHSPTFDSPKQNHLGTVRIGRQEPSQAWRVGTVADNCHHQLVYQWKATMNDLDSWRNVKTLKAAHLGTRQTNAGIAGSNPAESSN